MARIDWVILCSTLLFIIIYGVYKNRSHKNIKEYLKGGNKSSWWTVGLSVMATQASAITFLSTPGQAYFEGMGFVQFYFGLPLAMIIICIFFLPVYQKLKVYTAYEFLENRFNLKTRILTASLFLIQRGLAAGITIYAPAIILSVILGWNLKIMVIIIGLLVIFYTLFGGTLVPVGDLLYEYDPPESDPDADFMLYKATDGISETGLSMITFNLFGRSGNVVNLLS